MSNEHIQHRQCQTCFVDFQTTQELVHHIEQYRSEERLLVAKLERCRLHLAQSCDINSDNDDDDDRDREDGEDDDHEPPARPDQLQCPFRGCKRVEPYTTRGNLVRHFQTHIQCYEMCIFCHEIFRQVHRFLRHGCNDSSDKPKDTYMQRRVAQLNRMVSEELDRLQNSPSHTRKRAGEVVESGSIRAQKMVKTTQISVLPANTTLQSHHSVASSMATEDELPSSETMKLTVTNNTNGTFDEAAVMRCSNNAKLIFSSETNIGMPANDGGWGLASMMPKNDSGWAFAQVPARPANDGGWAFAVPAMPTNDGGWAFAETVPTMPANNGEWAFTETVD